MLPLVVSLPPTLEPSLASVEQAPFMRAFSVVFLERWPPAPPATTSGTEEASEEPLATKVPPEPPIHSLSLVEAL